MRLNPLSLYECSMTVAVSCSLPDGVILGVDSAVTVPASGGVAKVYENAEKIFQLGSRPIGIATYGLGALGTRSIGSYIREFEVKKSDEILKTKDQVKDVVEAFRQFFMEAYRDTVIRSIEASGVSFEQVSLEQRASLTLGFIIGGFSNGAYLPEVWHIALPSHDQPSSGILMREQGSFGTNWFAMFEPIRRYIKGFDPALLQEVLNFIGVSRGGAITPAEQQQIQAILQKYEYQIPYAAMPLQEGIAHTQFLVELAINHYRFAVGANVVGGRARIGRVTYNGEKFEILRDDGRI